MKILDRITLLRAGYTRKEIEEMIELEKQEPEQDPEQEQEKDPEQDPEPVVDFEKLYNQEKAAKEKLQEENRRRDNSGKDNEKSDEEIMKEIVSSFI